jgi:AcrR family transcriptional regulator
MTAQRRRPKAEPRPAARITRAERKQQVLATAKQLFATLGYAAMTMEMVASATDITESALTRHFENKPALFAAVLEEVRSATLMRWRNETGELADPLARLHAIIDLYLACTRSHSTEFRILHRALVESEDEEVLSLLRGFYQESETFLAEVIAEGQQTGVFRRSLDPRIGAWELIRAALGYMLTLPLGIPLYAEPDHLARSIECSLHCLLKTDV